MLRRQVSVLLGFLLLAAGLGYGLVHLFNLRMSKGDVFPAYSTLRADPVGTKVLLDSLNEIPGLNAWRNYRPLIRLKPAGPVTLVYAGINYESIWDEKELSHFEELMSSGSRAVFAFAPERAIDPTDVWAKERRKDALEKKEKEKEAKKKPAGKKDSAEDREERKRRQIESMFQKKGTPFATVADKWGFKFEVPTRAKGKPALDFTVKAEPAAEGLERSLPWHSELYFTGVKPPWSTLYSMHGNPVLIERPWGSGSIVLASDSYFLSNEGLFGKDRAPKLLAHLLGSPRTIVFDEEHLGVTEDAGISTLARKYRLHGLVAGLLLVAALFIWQNIVRFVPPQAQAIETDALVTGRASSEGFLVLLRRSIAAPDLLPTCLAEWRRTLGHDTRAVERLNAVAPPQPPRKPAEIVAAYAAIAQAVISNQKSVISKPLAPVAPPQPLATAGST
jgi:hypothetical protein